MPDTHTIVGHVHNVNIISKNVMTTPEKVIEAYSLTWFRGYGRLLGDERSSRFHPGKDDGLQLLATLPDPKRTHYRLDRDLVTGLTAPPVSLASLPNVVLTAR